MLSGGQLKTTLSAREFVHSTIARSEYAAALEVVPMSTDHKEPACTSETMLLAALVLVVSIRMIAIRSPPDLVRVECNSGSA